MIDNYTIKLAPGRNHKDLLKGLETMTDPKKLEKYTGPKAKIEFFCEAANLQRIGDP
jgi:hypothetical protein